MYNNYNNKKEYVFENDLLKQPTQLLSQGFNEQLVHNEDIGLRDWEHMCTLESSLASGFEVSIAACNPVHLGARRMKQRYSGNEP